MKTLIFLDYFTPAFKAGGPIRIFEALARDSNDEVAIVTQNRDWGSTEPLSGVLANQWVPFMGAKVQYRTATSFWQLRRLIIDSNPRVIHLNSFFSRTWTNRVLLMRALGLLRGIRVIVSPHGELAASALAMKGGRKKLLATIAKACGLYRGLEWMATAPKEVEEVQALLGSRVQTHLVPPPFPPAFPHFKTVKKAGQLRMIFLARLSAMKNLGYLVDVLKGVRGEIEFDIYGPLDPAYADEWARVLHELLAIKHINVSYKGALPSHLSAETLARYDLFVQPSFSENFGYSIIEALASGTPVLISDQTPWNDVNRVGAGFALPLDSSPTWVRALQSCIDLDSPAWSEMSERARAWVAAKSVGTAELLKVYRA